ncbi:MAG: type II toxin-antitoxin system RelE/ParE family toxin [Eubacterium sp.]
MKIVYTPAAINDINSTSDYLKNELKNPQAAQKFKEHILHTISLLKDNPEIGPLLSSKYDTVENNYRYIIVNEQIVFYEINDSIIEIIRVLDGRTDYLVHLI